MGTKIEEATTVITSGIITSGHYVPVGKTGLTTSARISLEELKTYILSTLDKITEGDSKVEVIDSGTGTIVVYLDNALIFTISATKLEPNTTNSFDLGSSSKKIKDLYIAGGIELGSDAEGDLYYRNSSGNLTRLGIGSASQVLSVAAGIPSWTTLGSTPARWANIGGTATYASSSTFTSTTTLTAGTPVRYRTGSGAYDYGIITSVAAGSPNTYTIAGTPINAADDGFEYGNSDLVHVENIHIDGAYEDGNCTSGATGGLLYEDLNASNHYMWRKATCHLVSMVVSHKTNDTGSNNATITIKRSSNNVTYTSMATGVVISTSITSTLVTISSSGVIYGDYIDFDITQGVSGNGDASDLDIQLIFVTV